MAVAEAGANAPTTGSTPSTRSPTRILLQPEHKGNIKAMAEDWIAWGKQNQS